MRALVRFFFPALLAGATFATAQTVTTDPVGFNTVTCLAGSDTRISVPLCKAVALRGVTSALPSQAGSSATIPIAGVTLTADQYASTYFVRFSSGSKDGMYYQILGNDATSVTVDSAGDDLTAVPASTSLAICEFWTLATLFPPATQTTIVPSLGNLGFQLRTMVLLPDQSTQDINLAPSSGFYLVGSEWRQLTTGFPNANAQILWPDSFFIVRHNHASITQNTDFTVTGTVELGELATMFQMHTTRKVDNAVSHGRPVPVKLRDLGLISSGAFTPSLGNLGFQLRDLLLVFDNSIAGINKAASAAYYYSQADSHWHQQTTDFPIADDVELKASEGFIIRKHTGGGGSVTWTAPAPF